MNWPDYAYSLRQRLHDRGFPISVECAAAARDLLCDLIERDLLMTGSACLRGLCTLRLKRCHARPGFNFHSGQVEMRPAKTALRVRPSNRLCSILQDTDDK